MTRDEFIDGYMERSGITPESRDDDGLVADGCRFQALPCHCGDESCDGWQMDIVRSKTFASKDGTRWAVKYDSAGYFTPPDAPAPHPNAPTWAGDYTIPKQR